MTFGQNREQKEKKKKENAKIKQAFQKYGRPARLRLKTTEKKEHQEADERLKLIK